MIEIFVGALISTIAIIGYIETRISKELKPNSGTSMKDQLNKLSTQVELILSHLNLK